MGIININAAKITNYLQNESNTQKKSATSREIAL